MIAAASSTSPKRPIGIFSNSALTVSGAVLAFMGVAITAGASALMVTPLRAYSLPSPLARPIRPALLAT